MIGHLRGSLISINNGRAIVTPDSGTGYVVILPFNEVFQERSSVGFYIWHAISQDDQKLFAFGSPEERWLAELIATTHRIGPAIAHRAVTTLGHAGITTMIQRGDEAGLTKAVKGLGAKGASAIIANLKGRLGELVAAPDLRARQVRNGLRAIGIDPDLEYDNRITALCAARPGADTATILNAVLAQR